MNESLTVSIGPHIKDKISTKRIMWAVTFSLLPAGVAGVFIFGINSLFVIISAVIAALATEALMLAMRKKDIGVMDTKMCILVAVLFALEHNEWLMGFLCGLMFTWLMVKTRDIWVAILAHAFTNGLLGWYAVHTGAYWFW